MPSFAPMVYIERAVLDPMGRQLFANTLTTEEPSTAQVALTEQAVLALTALRSCADHIRYTRNDREWIEGRASAHGKMIASVMAALAERDLIRERIKSGIAAAKARGKRLGRQPGQRPSDRKAKKVLKLAGAGLSYRLIGRHVGLSKNTVGAILQRARAANQ